MPNIQNQLRYKCLSKHNVNNWFNIPILPALIIMLI